MAVERRRSRGADESFHVNRPDVGWEHLEDGVYSDVVRSAWYTWRMECIRFNLRSRRCITTALRSSSRAMGSRYLALQILKPSVYQKHTKQNSSAHVPGFSFGVDHTFTALARTRRKHFERTQQIYEHAFLGEKTGFLISYV